VEEDQLKDVDPEAKVSTVLPSPKELAEQVKQDFLDALGVEADVSVVSSHVED
jgi:hypothetical protein